MNSLGVSPHVHHIYGSALLSLLLQVLLVVVQYMNVCVRVC